MLIKIQKPVTKEVLQELYDTYLTPVMDVCDEETEYPFYICNAMRSATSRVLFEIKEAPEVFFEVIGQNFTDWEYSYEENDTINDGIRHFCSAALLVGQFLVEEGGEAYKKYHETFENCMRLYRIVTEPEKEVYVPRVVTGSAVRSVHLDRSLVCHLSKNNFIDKRRIGQIRSALDVRGDHRPIELMEYIFGKKLLYSLLDEIDCLSIEVPTKVFKKKRPDSFLGRITKWQTVLFYPERFGAIKTFIRSHFDDYPDAYECVKAYCLLQLE